MFDDGDWQGLRSRLHDFLQRSFLRSKQRKSDGKETRPPRGLRPEIGATSRLSLALSPLMHPLQLPLPRHHGSSHFHGIATPQRRRAIPLGGTKRAPRPTDGAARNRSRGRRRRHRLSRRSSEGEDMILKE